MNVEPHLLQYLITGMVVSGLSSVLLVVVHAMTLLNRNKPQRRDVTLTAEAASKEELAKLDTEAAASIRRIHQRIDPLVENTAHIKGEVEALRQSFDNFTQILIAQRRND